MLRFVRVLSCLALTVAAIVGCVSTPPPQPPTVVSFSVSPDVALQPSPQATLSWEVRHVAAVTLATAGGETLGEFEAMGELTVAASSSTTYVLTASNDAGDVSASATLTVQPFGPVMLRRVADGGVRPLGAVTVSEPVDLVVRVLIVPPPGTSVTDVTADLGVGPAIQLRDDGSPASGDDIFGDGVFSGRAVVAFPGVGASEVSVTMVIDGGSYTATASVVVVQELSGDELADVEASNEAVADFLEALGTTSGIDEVIEAIEAFTLENLDALGIESIETFPRYAIRHHTSGLSSVLLFYDEREGVRGASMASASEVAPQDSTPEPAGVPAVRPNAAPQIPLERQTRGTALVDDAGAVLAPAQGGVIGPATNEIPRSVLIWTPYATEFQGWGCDKTALVADAFAKSELGFDVTILQDAAATVDSLTNIAEYGYVFLDTHGAAGWILVTGDTPTDGSPYWGPEWAARHAFPCSGYIWTGDGYTVAADDRWCVTPTWFTANVDGPMPHTIVFNSSCESTMTDDFWDAFRALGAQTYLGYSETVRCVFARDRAEEFSESIASGSTAGQAHTTKTDLIVDWKGLTIYRAEWQLRGSSWQRFATDLYNPFFHMGLAGWSTIGDGRAITRLGVGERAQQPVTGSQMAVISSGLGFTTSRGAIQQTFRVPDWATRLSFDWNFLSEEFLEFIGSPYQDQFVVSVITADGTETVLLDLTIDSVATEFGASHCYSPTNACLEERGDLLRGWDVDTGSQYVRFDRGDVWLTGWQRSAKYDISGFAGRVVTLRFFATDVTDEVYDTAVVIDNIWIE